MALGRMTRWREAQRRRAGGMVEISTWVPSRAATFLKEIFGRLADPGSRGDAYRQIATAWLKRRRVVGDNFDGGLWWAEIDRPILGTSWYSRPAGGRVVHIDDTWVELTPDEASEVKEKCRAAISGVLQQWLDAKGLTGRVVDKVGVAPDTYFSRGDFRPGPDDVLLRPVDDDEFERNEVEIAQAVKDAALKASLHPTDDPTIVYFSGVGGFPSRCHAIHQRIGGRVLFALVHVPNGGTSPTNMILELIKKMHRQFYPGLQLRDIDWFDCWVLPWESPDEPTIARVVEGEGGIPNWQAPGDLPEEFVGRIRHVCKADRERSATGSPSPVDVAP